MSKKYNKLLNELLTKFSEDSDCKKHMDILLEAFYNNLQQPEPECVGLGLDGKRPFGNSDIPSDVANLIDIDIYDEDGESINGTQEYCWWLFDHLWAYVKYSYLQSK